MRYLQIAVRHLWWFSRFRPVAGAEPKVAYYGPRFPSRPANRGEIATGGAVKLTYLAEAFPHEGWAANILYVVNGLFPKPARHALPLLRRKGVRLVLNQNGVVTPFSYNYRHKHDYPQANRGNSALHRLADRIVYQSDFCRRGAERFLAPRSAPWTVAFNPADVASFRPVERDRSGRDYPWRLFVIAMEGHRRRRMEAALDALAALRTSGFAAARLHVAGHDPAGNPRHAAQVEWLRGAAAARALPAEAVEIRPGRYSRAEAPAVLAHADVLLHPAYMDPCPNLVCEALACGLPVVYSRSGGVPELVGPAAGVGVDAPEDWNESHEPPGEALAAALAEVLRNHAVLSAAARRRAEEVLGVPDFVAAHREVFGAVLARGGSR